jgi:hypothetical protein
MSTATTGTALITTGRVGINIADPTVPLDVTGAARISGELNMNSNKIVNVTTPSANLDAANKSYVDAAEVRATAVGNAAQTTANTAVTNAAAAQTTANTAKTTADNLVVATSPGTATANASRLHPADGTASGIVTNGTWRVYVTTAGNVGIGPSHTSPSVLLDVAGAAKIAGELNMNSNKIVNVTTPTAAADAANKSYVDTSIPIGGIIMWSGSSSSLPTNWKFCNGANGTPDLRGRFVMCMNRELDGSYDKNGPINFWANINTTGGSPDAVVVSHSHSVNEDGAGAYTPPQGRNPQGAGNHGHVATAASDGFGYHVATAVNHTHSVSVNPFGESGSNKNLPQYYALAYIMRIS